MTEKNDHPDVSPDRTECRCTHPTHFLGRCRQPVEPPESRCVECMENHFHRVDDPAI